MIGAANAVGLDPGLATKDADTDRKSSLIRWSDQPVAWRLRGLTLGLRAATMQSVALRTIIRHERLEREWARLEQLRRTLIADDAHSRHDPDARYRLALQVASFYRQVGVLERAVESVAEELSELTGNKSAMRA